MCFVKNDTPFFSVIIPAYNAGKYILLTLASVLEQSFSDYEIIIIDDGSTDNSQEVLGSIRDPRVRIITQKNAGASAARNRGIREANGVFLAFLDADDLWLPCHLELAKRFFDNYPEYGWYSSRCCRVKSEAIAQCKDKRLPYDEASVGYSVRNWFLEGDILECGSNFVIKKSLAREWDDFYPEGIVLCEDNVAWCRLAMRHPMMGVPDCCTVLYRMRSDSAVHLYGQNAEILQKSLQPVFRFHREFYLSPSCTKEAKLFFKKFSCARWCYCLKKGGNLFWSKLIKEQQILTGGWIAFLLQSFSLLSHILYRGAGKLLGLYISWLNLKISSMAKRCRVEGLK